MSVLVVNQKVLLKKDNCYKIVAIKSDKTVDLDRVKFSLNGLIGTSFGSSFTVENGNLVKIVDKSKFDQYEKLKVENLSENQSDTVIINTNRDNRNLNLNSKTQMMSANEIGEMKKNGESGDTIMRKLIENSTSFNQKTTYAQEKYLKKKKKRYLPVISVHRITTRTLCDLYAARGCQKIMHLRIDSVSQILAHCNASSDAKTLLVETTAGLLLGALLERGSKVINFFHGSAPVLPDSISEWSEVDGRVFHLPLAQLVPLATTGQFVEHCSSIVAPSLSDLSVDGPEAKRRRLTAEAITDRREERDRRREIARQFLMERLCDSLVVAIKFDPCALTLQLLNFLAPGKPFVVYSQFLRPLVDLYDLLRRDKSAPACCFLNISESWLREYQVLPERTHPFMNMSGTGGYLLTGIKLLGE